MIGTLSEREEQLLQLAREQNLLTSDRVFMLRNEKPFYPDISVAQLAVIKGYLSDQQAHELNQLATASQAAAAPEPPAKEPMQAAAPQVGEPSRAPAAPATPTAEVQPPPTTEEPESIHDDAIRSFARLEQYLGFARAQQASDLHISAGYPPYVRRFGRVQFLDRPRLEPHEAKDLLFGLLNEEQRNTLEEHLNLECAIDVGGQGRYRATFTRQQKGWDGTFHIIRSAVPSIKDLGLPPSILRLADYRQGMILVTGPSGCGKTTTMAAMVEHVNANRREHILTLEQPIEYVYHPQKAQVNQREIGRHTKSYQRALRAALREDPDVIMLGEMRDLETISLAITAAETGHLIFGTLNTTTAARTVSRILDSYPPNQQPQIRTMIAESLRGIICQQLIPRLDRPGVALALEVLVVTPGIASLIREMKTHQVASAIQTGKRLGMIRMEDSLMELYNQKIISVEEAYARADDKRAFAPLLPP